VSVASTGEGLQSVGSGYNLPQRNGGERTVIWLLVLLLLLLAIGGGVVVSKLLFLVLVVALALALFGVFNRSTT
jgi:hypothetical protein